LGDGPVHHYNQEMTGSSTTAIPPYSLNGLRVLDIGCNDGRVFTQAPFRDADCHGIDVDGAAVASGIKQGFKLTLGPAESLPYPDEMFDVVMSRVALPYTHIPTSLSEAFRVLKPRGRLFLSMHDLRLQMEFLRAGMKARSIKRVLDHVYIFAASTLFNATGICVSRPWKPGQYETFQTAGRMFKELKRTGFSNYTAERVAHHFIVRAEKPSARDIKPGQS
jgi:ubiquinone/menaquinone biosynthesis C-methylase UbiE